jgi:DNA-binding CsgD family transcriptional regulator
MRSLTPRQMAICRMIVEGKQNKEIALTEKKGKMSVAHQIQHIMAATGATNRAMIAAWYVRHTEVRS